MSGFSDITVYLPKDGIDAKCPPPIAVQVAPRRTGLRRRLRRLLLQEDASFQATLRLPGKQALGLHWTPVGVTAGVACWMGPGGVEAASILFSGLELHEDLESILRLFADINLTLPQGIWRAMGDADLPLLTTIHYGGESSVCRVITAASTALATVFFGLLGTIGESA